MPGSKDYWINKQRRGTWLSGSHIWTFYSVQRCGGREEGWWTRINLRRTDRRLKIYRSTSTISLVSNINLQPENLVLVPLCRKCSDRATYQQHANRSHNSFLEFSEQYGLGLEEKQAHLIQWERWNLCKMAVRILLAEVEDESPSGSKQSPK